MNDVPLIQKADINSINTSIIAIKKQLKQLTEAVGLIDVPDVDTSVFVKKTDVVDVVEADNMSPVTSNAVYEAVKEEVLWENPNPTSSFSPTTLTSQTLGKDLSKYYAIYVYARNVGGGNHYSVTKVYKDLQVSIITPAQTIMYRRVTFTDNGIAIEAGSIILTYGSSATADNGVVIPIKIWGIKSI